jgi:hypothetical protein
MGLGVPHSQHLENVPDVLCLKPKQKRRKAQKAVAAKSISLRLHAKAPDLGGSPNRVELDALK